jgi:hypothetical protein
LTDQSDHDILMVLCGKMDGQTALLSQIATGNTANCAREKERVDSLNFRMQQIEADRKQDNAHWEKEDGKLWKEKASGLLVKVLIGLWGTTLGMCVAIMVKLAWK